MDTLLVQQNEEIGDDAKNITEDAGEGKGFLIGINGNCQDEAEDQDDKEKNGTRMHLLLG